MAQSIDTLQKFLSLNLVPTVRLFASLGLQNTGTGVPQPLDADAECLRHVVDVVEVLGQPKETCVPSPTAGFGVVLQYFR